MVSNLRKTLYANLNIVVAIIFISIILIFIFSNNKFLHVKFIIYTVLVITALILIVFIIRLRHAPKSKLIDEETILMKPKKLLGRLILPNNEEFILKDYERKLGREDFLGYGDDLLYISKEHFKLIRLDDGFYIEDLNTKNGTKINGEDIRGLGKIKLRNGDEIKLPGLKIYYLEN